MKLRLETNKKVRREWLLPLVVSAYALFGVIMVYSSSKYNAEVIYGDEYFFLKKQLLGYVIGLAAMIAISFFDYRVLLKVKAVPYIAVGVSALLLALVFVPGLGVAEYGATRWIGLGPITLQPSEVAKYGFVLFAAFYIAKNPQRVKSFVGILPLLLTGGMICLLIILEPNMSVTVLMASVMLGMIFLSGAKLRHMIVILIPFVFAVPALILAEPYRLLRLSAFLNPWASPKEEGYQLIQSLYALGNGSWFGVGLFHSRQKYRFLPFAESDFILSVIGEEFGFFGVVVLFFIAGVIVYKGFSIGAKCSDLFGSMLSFGVTFVFAFQTVLNALVVSGSIPPTGLPLPLISSGNTSLIITMVSMGLVTSVSTHLKNEKNI